MDYELEVRENELKVLESHLHAINLESESSKSLCKYRGEGDCEIPRCSPVPVGCSFSESERILLEKNLKDLNEISELREQITRVRSERNSQSLSEFNTLIDLALTLESLHAELSLERKKRKERETTSPLSSPIVEATRILSTTVKSLEKEVFDRETFYSKETKLLMSDLGRTRTKQKNMKSEFHKESTSVFTDIKFISDRIDRAESSLDKLNIHYQLTEEEMLAIVAPLIDEIDAARNVLWELDNEARFVLLKREPNEDKEEQELMQQRISEPPEEKQIV